MYELMMKKLLDSDRRLVVGGHFSIPQPLKIIAIKSENAITKTFVLDGRLVAEPGQFVMIWLPGLEDKLRITVGTPKQNDALVTAIKDIIG